MTIRQVDWSEKIENFSTLRYVLTVQIATYIHDV